jgi:dipeptidyl aminopeptidase/acylaminoacyl peptidase
VVPFRISSRRRRLVLRPGATRTVTFKVLSADRASLALVHPLNRLRVRSSDGRVAAASIGPDGATVTVAARSPGRARLIVVYQRLLADGTYRDVHQGRRGVKAVPLHLPIRVTRRSP